MKHQFIIVFAGLSLILAIPFDSKGHPIASKVIQPHKVIADALPVPKSKPVDIPTPSPVVTPQPTPEPTVVATPVPVNYGSYSTGCNAYAELIDQYPWNHATAEAICQAESGGNPEAISPLNNDGLRDYGLFQIHGEEILDPAANVARAYQKYVDQGWYAWTTFTSGKYLSFME